MNTKHEPENKGAGHVAIVHQIEGSLILVWLSKFLNKSKNNYLCRCGGKKKHVNWGRIHRPVRHIITF